MNATQMIETWRKRDALYSNRKTSGAPSLTPEEITSVKWWRRIEADSLTGIERVRALTDLARWEPPRGRRI